MASGAPAHDCHTGPRQGHALGHGDPCTAWMELNRAPPLPVVQYANGVRRAIGPFTWDVKVNGGNETLVRVQMPLTQAWALTVHKCQGARKPWCTHI